MDEFIDMCFHCGRKLRCLSDRSVRWLADIDDQAWEVVADDWRRWRDVAFGKTDTLTRQDKSS